MFSDRVLNFYDCLLSTYPHNLDSGENVDEEDDLAEDIIQKKGVDEEDEQGEKEESDSETGTTSQSKIPKTDPNPTMKRKKRVYSAVIPYMKGVLETLRRVF